MKYRYIIITLSFFLFLSIPYRIVSANTIDTTFVNALITKYRSNTKKPWAKATLDSIRTLSSKLNYNDGQLYYFFRKSQLYLSKEPYDTCKLYLDSLQILSKTSGNKFYQALNLRERGRLFSQKNDFENAISLYLGSLKLFDHTTPSPELAITYQYLGIAYFRIAELKSNNEYGKKSLEYFKQCLDMAKKTHSEDLEARALNNIGSLNFHILKNYDAALEYFQKSLVLKQKLNLKSEMSGAYNNIGNSLCMIAREKKDNSLYTKAIENYNIALEIIMRQGDTMALILAYSNLASAYVQMQQIENAFGFMKKAENLNKRAHSINLDLTIMNVACDIYYLKKDYKNAYDILKRLQAIKDSVQTQESMENLNKMQVEYGSFKKDKEIELLTKDKLISDLELVKKEADINRQQILIISVVIVLSLSLLLSFFIYKNNKEKQVINARLSERNKDITDSINYAKLIQQAIFSEKEIKYRLFPDAFVLLLPKDVVSGDFYWFGEQNGKRIIASVDCTGHGVPGAFMSMIGNAFLNEIINEKKITTPAKILDELRTAVVRSLKQEASAADNKDGMDISICVFENDFSSCEFAGANNPLWLIRKGELKEIAADKQPIGLSGKELKPFTNHKLKLEKDDIIYIFTDGFADQFGGEKGKKFKYKQLQQLLISSHTKSMPTQEAILLSSFNAWKGNLEQVDDVCIIGIRA